MRNIGGILGIAAFSVSGLFGTGGILLHRRLRTSRIFQRKSSPSRLHYGHRQCAPYSLKLWIRADPAYRDRKLNGYGGLVALVAEGCPYLNILVYVI